MLFSGPGPPKRNTGLVKSMISRITVLAILAVLSPISSNAAPDDAEILAGALVAKLTPEEKVAQLVNVARPYPA